MTGATATVDIAINEPQFDVLVESINERKPIITVNSLGLFR